MEDLVKGGPSLAHTLCTLQDERPKKKVKTSSKGMKLSSFLPPPRNQGQAGMAGVLGSVVGKVKPSAMPVVKYPSNVTETTK